MNLISYLILACLIGVAFGIWAMYFAFAKIYGVGKRFLKFVKQDKNAGLLVFERGTVFMGVKHIILTIGDRIENPYTAQKGRIVGMHFLFNKKIKEGDLSKNTLVFDDIKVTKPENPDGFEQLSDDEFNRSNEKVPDTLFFTEGFTKLAGSWTVRYDIIYDDNTPDILEDSDILKYIVSTNQLESYLAKHDRFIKNLRNFKKQDNDAISSLIEKVTNQP